MCKHYLLYSQLYTTHISIDLYVYSICCTFVCACEPHCSKPSNKRFYHHCRCFLSCAICLYLSVSVSHPISCRFILSPPLFRSCFLPFSLSLCVCVLFVHERLCARLLCVYFSPSLFRSPLSFFVWVTRVYGVRGRVYASLMPSVHLTPADARESDNLFFVLRTLFFRIIPNALCLFQWDIFVSLFLYARCIFFGLTFFAAVAAAAVATALCNFRSIQNHIRSSQQNLLLVLFVVVAIANVWFNIYCRCAHTRLHLNETDWCTANPTTKHIQSKDKQNEYYVI